MPSSTDPNVGTAELRFGLNDTDGYGPAAGVTAGQWHHVLAVFDTQGNTVNGDGDLEGLATLQIDGVPVHQDVVKSNYGGIQKERLYCGCKYFIIPAIFPQPL